jgi:hypothetical protein
VAAPSRDDAAPADPQVLGAVGIRTKVLIGWSLIAVGVLAVVLVAGGAPVPLRAPVVLVAATLLPGYPLVVRLPLDLPTLLALDVCASLAIEGGSALLLVTTRLWHPMGLGLVLAVVGVGGILVALASLPAAPAPANAPPTGPGSPRR